MSDLPRRKNGLSRPYIKAQIAAWIAFVLSILQFLIVVAPMLPNCVSPTLTLFFLITVFCVSYFGIKAIIIDPVDVHLSRYLKEGGFHYGGLCSANNTTNIANNDNEKKKDAASVGTKLEKYFDKLYDDYNGKMHQQDLPDEPMKQCWICDTQVAEHSMHCKFCNKCVYHFDHHCMWLNTCVGQANYRPFFRTMLSLFIMELTHLVPQLYLIIDILAHGPSEKRAARIYQEQTVTAILFLFVAFNITSLILIGQLIHFHLQLQKENLTTYEFIVQDHKKKRQQARLEGDLENQRVVEMARLEREGNKSAAKKLQFGGMCRQVGCPRFDPLDLPSPEPEPDPQAGFAASLGNPNRALNGNTNNFNVNNNNGTNETDGMGYQETFSTHENSLHNTSAAVEAAAAAEAEEDGRDITGNQEKLQTTEMVSLSSNSSHSYHSRAKATENSSHHSGARAQAAPALSDERPDETSGAVEDQGGDTGEGSSSHPDPDENHDEDVEVPLIQYSSTICEGDDDDKLPGGEGEVFENEPDDISYTSGCSGRSGRATSDDGERDYTAF